MVIELCPLKPDALIVGPALSVQLHVQYMIRQSMRETDT